MPYDTCFYDSLALARQSLQTIEANKEMLADEEIISLLEQSLEELLNALAVIPDLDVWLLSGDIPSIRRLHRGGQ